MEDYDLNQLTGGKSFKKELKTDKNNTYLIIFTLGNSLEIEANQINDLITKSFSNKFSFNDIRTNRYFLQFETLNEIFDELNEIIKNDKISIEESENNFKIKVLLPGHKNKEIIFELRIKNKNDKEKINDLTQLVIKQNEEMTEMKNEITQLKEENTNLKNEVDKLKNEDTKLKNEVNQLKNEITLLKKEDTKLKEKLDIIWKEKEEKEKEKIQIQNLNSKIINENDNEKLKEWINPLKKIKAELLYRLSENGDKCSTFHQLCDNKGPTLTLFHVNDGNKVGIYTPLSWESSEKGFYKKDKETFIFNLNKNKKYEKKGEDSIYCDSSSGPNTPCFGTDNTMKSISIFSKIDSCYPGASDILPGKCETEDFYDLLEAEVYKIIIE